MMYGKLSALSGTAGGATALAYTGVDVLWIVLAAFTLVSAGFALLRVLPRRES